MEYTEYTIKKAITNTKRTDIFNNIENIKNTDRSIHFETEGNPLCIEIEFKPVIIKEIHLGIMTSAKIDIKGRYRGMDVIKVLINKTEKVETIIKAVIYKDSQFVNVRII